MKQKHYIAGLYFRLSQEDERQGESVSIDNQRSMLRKYAEEHGFEVHDEYIDDGVSGTTFDRPDVQRLLDDAKTGVINTIIVKDLSRFGRNYIEVGQYVDYVFPAFGIRFITIQDNVDTENRDSNAMEMMPIMAKPIILIIPSKVCLTFEGIHYIQQFFSEITKNLCGLPTISFLQMIGRMLKHQSILFRRNSRAFFEDENKVCGRGKSAH